MTIIEFNQLEPSKKKALLTQCCGSSAWVEKMMNMPSVENLSNFFTCAEDVWYACKEEDWKEAFLHHPKIGDIDALRKKFSSDQFAGTEQGSVSQASEATLQHLAEGNTVYEAKFGYIFIVCATGKSAGEMLDLLTRRLQNLPHEEIKIAMEEQNKITKLRLQKVLSEVEG